MSPFLLKYLLFMLTLFFSVVTYSSPALDEKERDWIAENPEILYGFDDSWPLEFRDNGTHTGLSRDYLTLIEYSTGLRFRLAKPGEQPVMLTNLSPELMSATERYRWRYSQRWLTLNAVVVTSQEEHHIRTLENLSGKRIAVRADSWYERWLKEHHPEIQVVPFPDVHEVLNAVYTGNAKAAIGADVLMRPVLYQNYSHHLAIAAMLPEMVSGMHIGVIKELPELQSILNKALAAMPVSESDAIFKRWLSDMNMGYPSREVIMSLYSVEITLFALLIMILFGSLYNALRLKRRAIRNEARKSQFLAMMSHEIRTPLNALTAALELLRLPCPDKLQRDYTELAYQSSLELLRLLDNILEHCMLSQKQVKLENNYFSLDELVRSLCMLHQPAALRKGLLLKSYVDPVLKTRWVVADESRLRQILSNLLSNAIKFTDRGYVQLELIPAEGMNRLKFRVADTGMGIPASARRCLFDAWTQADNVSTSRHGGSGLGLYICRELVRLAGGKLTWKSQQNKGAVFTVEIPVTLCEKPKLQEPVTTVSVPRFTEQSSVLVVEDHPASRQMLAAQLDVLGCHYDLVCDGESALKKLEDEHYYSVVLLDCNLPDKDGYEVAKLIRDYESKKGIDSTPIVAISAMSSTQHQQLCDESRINMILSKPITIERLGGVLSIWCSVSDEEQAEWPADFPSEKDAAAWLKEDIHQFCIAAESRDLCVMRYYLHRIKGAAQMYQFGALAELAAEIEVALPQAIKLPEGDITSWVEKLRSRFFSAAHF